MADNIYVDVDGRLYASTYPFSVNDSLIPIVSPSFRASLEAVTRKPNATQRTLNLRSYMTDDTMRNGLVKASLTFQAAFRELREYGGTLIIPPGDYDFDREVLYWPNVTVKGEGSGAVRIFTTDTWVALTDTDRAFLASFNDYDNFSGYYPTPIEGNILIDGITFDYRQRTWTGGSGKHAFRTLGLKNVAEQNCTFYSGENAVSLRRGDGSRVINNQAYDQTNCAWDHWQQPKNALVANNSFKTTVNTAQALNFNPESAGATPGTGLVADGFVAIGNTIEGSPTDTLPWQLEPLDLGNGCINILVEGNQLINSYIVMRGTVINASVSNNTMWTAQGNPTQNIVCHGWGAGPDDEPNIISITNNVIHANDPGNPFGNIRLELEDGYNGAVVGNRIYNPTSATNGIYTTGSGIVVSDNTVENGLISAPGFVSTRQDILVPNGKSVGWRRASGYQTRAVLQSDNNWVFYLANSTGGQRAILSCYAEQDNSDLVVSPILRVNGGMRWEDDLISANGTTIASATTLAAYSQVDVCVAGVNDAVKLPQSANKLTLVFNNTADILRLFPVNSGLGRIDGGAISAPVNIAPGESRLMWQWSDNNAKTLAKYP